MTTNSSGMKDFVDWLDIVSSSELVLTERTVLDVLDTDILYGYQRLEAGDKSNLYVITHGSIICCERLMYDSI